MCTCAILPGKAVPEMAYTVSGGMLNFTYSLTHFKNFVSVREIMVTWNKFCELSLL